MKYLAYSYSPGEVVSTALAP